MAETTVFKNWAKLEVAKRTGQKSIEQQVEEAMEPQHLRVEVYNDGHWVEDDLES